MSRRTIDSFSKVTVSRCPRGSCTRTGGEGIDLHQSFQDAVTAAMLLVRLRPADLSILFDDPCTLRYFGCPLDGSTHS